MKQTLFILILLMTLTSCATRKRLSNDIVYDANAEKYQQALQRSKDVFFTNDSADSIYKNLGWAERVVTRAKFDEYTIPSVFKNVGDEVFRVEMPCQEFESDEFWASTVIVEHKRLDSALVKAKIQGVDVIFSGSRSSIKAHFDQQGEYIIDSIEYTSEYANYIRKAQFSCLCVMKVKKKYIVNATIRVPKNN